MESEKIIHQASPSQVLNFWIFVACILVIPIPYAIWKWMQVRAIKLKLTDQRIIISQGVFTKTTKEVELYRVRDVTVEEPFFYRMFGLGTVTVHSTDEDSPIIKLQAYKNPHQLKDQIRHYTEDCRQKRRWGNDNVLIHDHQL